MNNIKVGEYVRTKDGKIDRIKNNDYYMQQYIECEKGLYLRKNIVKNSKNITDLIEVGDIVIFEDEFDKNIYYMYDESFVEATKQDIKEGETLKSILTREEFEKRKYNI